MPVVVRRPAPPLDGLITAITYRAGEQPRTSVEKILPSPETGLWLNLNRDAFRSFSEGGQVHRVPGAMVAGPASHASVIEFEEGHAHVSVAFALGAAHCFLAPPLSLVRDDADQPHLADEFRELVGVTPTEYLRSRVDGPNHLRFPSCACRG